MKSDLIDCVIGLAANLFYNSSMEACILVCRKNKKVAKRGQILFINAVNDATRKNAESYLEESHIKKIADAYAAYSDIDEFAKVVTIDEVAKNNFSLSIPLYIKQKSANQIQDGKSIEDCFGDWSNASDKMNVCLNDLEKMI